MRHLLLPSPEFPLIRNEAVELVRGPLHGWFPLLSLSVSLPFLIGRQSGNVGRLRLRRQEKWNPPAQKRWEAGPEENLLRGGDLGNQCEGLVNKYGS